MKIIDINDERDLSKVEDSVGVALGNFDGVHRGHGKLIGEMIEGSKKRGLKSSVLLFKNHTKILLDKNSNIKVLTSNEEKINILNGMGVDIVYLIDFDRKLMELSGEDFIKKILLDKMKVKYITVGFDYRFGHRAGSTSKDLYNYSLDYGFEANIVDAIYVDEELISSTMIRGLIVDGKIEEANNYLGRPYSIEGRVVRGASRGHTLGFPTANLEKSEPFVMPKIGVYYTKTEVDGILYRSLTNIGYNPTFTDSKDNLKIESYILDFSQDIYGKKIKVYFIEYLRSDVKFDSAEALISQMNQDLEKVKKHI